MAYKTLNKITLYTGPNPPFPSTLPTSKLFVAVSSFSKSYSGSSSNFICLRSLVVKFRHCLPEMNFFNW